MGAPEGVAEAEEEAVLEADSEADSEAEVDVDETVTELEVVSVAVEWSADWASAPAIRVKVMRVKRMVKVVTCLLEEKEKVKVCINSEGNEVYKVKRVK